MKYTLFSCSLVVALTALILGQAVSLQPQDQKLRDWVPPTAREKAKTPFAPKPTEGSNIFKGDAEKWLADAIVKVESGPLMPIEDKELTNYVSQVGLNLVKYSRAPNEAFDFVILPEQTESAFTMGAGRVYITVGMLKALENEDELAAILAHEIGHNAFKHAAKTVTRQLFWMKGITKIDTAADAEKALRALDAAYSKNMFATLGESLLGWSRNDELLADKAGFYNMYKAGYNPEAMKSVFRRFVASEKSDARDHYASAYFLTMLFGSHPPASQRVTALKWESNWVKMPKKDERYNNAAFDAMKAHLAKL